MTANGDKAAAKPTPLAAPGAATVAALLREGEARLAACGVPDARLDAELLLATLCGVPRLHLRLQGTRTLTDVQLAQWATMLARRVAREPLQYVLGTQDFMGRTFAVDARVLIPRQDTEILCERAIAVIAAMGAAEVLDMGTGSGALAVSLALACPRARVTAVDISEEALDVARANACRLGASVRLIRSDMFAQLAPQWFDCIVSNPPYIPAPEMEALQQEVRREPRLALDGGADGLDFYRALVREAPNRLRKGGWLLVEVGDGQAGHVAAFFAAAIGEPETLADWGGLPRVVCARYTKG